MVHDVHDVQLQSGRCYVLYVWHLKLAHDPWRAHYPAAARPKVRVWTAVVPFKSRVCGNWKGKNEDIMIIRWKYSQTPACQTKSCWNKGLHEKISPVLKGQCNKLLNAVQWKVAPPWWKEPIPKHGGTCCIFLACHKPFLISIFWCEPLMPWQQIQIPSQLAGNRNEIHLAHVDWQVGVLVLFGLKELQSWNLLEWWKSTNLDLAIPTLKSP